MNAENSEKKPKNRYEELMESLALLSEEQLRSYCLTESDEKTIGMVLNYKRKTN